MSGIVRPAALKPGQRVKLLMGSDAVQASDSRKAYLVTDQTDKKGNPLLVDMSTGAAAIASPSAVFTLY